MSIFISYSRRNTDFVRQLHGGIVARGRETWVDWEGIPPTADWMQEIHAAIDAAEAVAFVLSPDSIMSTVCLQELEYATAQNKRLIPLVCQEVNPAETPPALARLNWVFFTGDDFEQSLGTLLSAVDTDLDWVQAHTRLLVRSAEWDRATREPSLALRGADLKAAEQWLTEGPKKSPLPTELQTRYIIDSRRQATKRRSLLLSGVGVALTVSAALGTLFLLQRQESGRQEAIAVSRRLAAVADRVREAPLEYSGDASRLQLSAQLAAEALRRVDAVGERSVEADRVLRATLARLPERVARLDGDARLTIDALAFRGETEVVAASKARSASVIWRLSDAKPVGGGSATGTASRVVLSPDADTLATIEPKHPDGPVVVRDARRNELKARIKESKDAVDVALARGATHVLVTQEKWLPDTNSYEAPISTLWQLLPAGRDARAVVTLPPIFGPVFSPDGVLLAAIGKDDKPLIWSIEGLSTHDASPLRSLATEAPLASRMLFSADGGHLAISYGENPRRIGIWSVSDWSRLYDLPTPDASYLIAVASGGHYVATAEPHGGSSLIRVFESAHQCEVAQAIADTSDAAVAFVPTGRKLAVASGNGVDVLAFPSGCGDEMQFDALSGAVAVVFSANEQHLDVVTQSGGELTLQRMEVPNARLLGSQPLGSASIAQFSADGSALALATENRVRLVDVATGAERARATSSDVVDALALSPEGRYLVAAMQGKQLQIWRGASLHELTSVPLPEPLDSDVGSLAIDPRHIIAITRGEARRIGEPLSVQSWTLPAMAHVAARAGQDRGGFAVTLCGLNVDGGRIAINAGVSGVRVRETLSGQDVALLDATGQLRRCAFSPNGHYLAVETAGFIRIWDVGRQTEVAQLRSSTAIGSIVFSPGDRYLAAILENGRVGLWFLRPQDLIEATCARLPTNLSTDDWTRYVGAVPPVPLCPKWGE